MFRTYRVTVRDVRAAFKDLVQVAKTAGRQDADEWKLEEKSSSASNGPKVYRLVIPGDSLDSAFIGATAKEANAYLIAMVDGIRLVSNG